MRKLNLENYTAKSKVPDNMNPGELLDIEFPYPTKDSLLTIMFDRALQLTGPELIRQTALALKIEACKGEVILEEEEWKRLVTAINTVRGFNRNDFPLIERITNAEEVEVEPKK